MKRRIDNLGRLTLPSEMREELNIELGGKVNIECYDNKIILTSPKEDNRIERAIEYIEDYRKDILDGGKALLEILEGDK